MNSTQKKTINKSIDKEVLRIAERLAGEHIGLNEPLYDYFDSLDVVECIMEMERVFDIAIEDEDVEQMNTLSECCAMLRNKYLYSPIDERSEKLRKINDIK